MAVGVGLGVAVGLGLGVAVGAGVGFGVLLGEALGEGLADALPIGAGFNEELGTGDVVLPPPPQPANDTNTAITADMPSDERGRTNVNLLPRYNVLIRTTKCELTNKRSSRDVA